MKIGISDNVFPYEWSLEKVLKCTSAVGYEGIELNLHEKEGFLNLNTLPEEAISIARKCRKYNIEVSSLTTLLLNKYPLNSPSEKKRKFGFEIAKKMTELAQAMQVKIIQIVPGTISPALTYNQSYELSKKAIEHLAEIIKTTEITLGIENVTNNFLSNPIEFSNFLNDVNTSSVQGYLDIGNARMYGLLNHWVNLLRDKIIAIHAKDISLETREFRPVLLGDVDWSLVIKKIKKYNFSGYIITTPPERYKHFPKRQIKTSYYDLQAVVNSYL